MGQVRLNQIEYKLKEIGCPLMLRPLEYIQKCRMKKNNVSGKKVPRYSTHFAVFTSGGAGWALTNVSVYLASGIALEGYM